MNSSNLQLVLSIFLMEGLLHAMPADETEIHVHEVDVGNIVHKEEELSLVLA